MDKFTTVTGVAAPLDMINVDTDMIIPARFLKSIKRTGFGEDLFYTLRYDEGGNEREDFVLNRSAYRNAEVLIAGKNFGCGSSREQAAWCCADFGFRVIIAPSLGDIFKANCAKLGVVPAIVASEPLERLRESLHRSPGATLTVNLDECMIRGPGNWKEPFHIEEYFRHRLLKGVTDFDLSASHTEAIHDFQQSYQQRVPWS